MEQKIINDIESRVLREIAINSTPDYSLLGGDFGQVLYLFYSSAGLVDKYERACIYIDKVIRSVKRRPLLPTYCNGLAGLSVGLISLENAGFLDEVTASIGVYDAYLTYCLEKLIKYDLDFLHGAIGIGVYFLKRAPYDKIAMDNIVKVLDCLEYHAKKYPKGGIFWLYPNRFKVLEQNLSLSHGICGTSMFLARAYNVMESDKYKDKCKRLLNGVGQYLVSNLINPEILNCYTPMIATGNKSRLGWCYGDIGTSIALRAIGEITQDDNFSNLSYEIALYTAINRHDLTADGINDACLCHGASGVAHFFYNCFSYYGNTEFLKAFDRWKCLTLQMYGTIDNQDMFGFFNYDTLKKQKCLNILSGDTGVALMLRGEYSLLDDLLFYKY